MRKAAFCLEWKGESFLEIFLQITLNHFSFLWPMRTSSVTQFSKTSKKRIFFSDFGEFLSNVQFELQFALWLSDFQVKVYQNLLLMRDIFYTRLLSWLKLLAGGGGLLTVFLPHKAFDRSS